MCSLLRRHGFRRVPLGRWVANLAACRSPCRLSILYGDPPDDQAFDFIHVETISSRSSIHDWTIRVPPPSQSLPDPGVSSAARRHDGGGATSSFAARPAILVAGPRWRTASARAGRDQGWVISFTEDVTHALCERSGQALARLRALAAEPIVRSRRRGRATVVVVRRSARGALSRGEGFASPCRLSALLAIEVARAGGEPRPSGAVTLQPARSDCRGAARPRGGAFPQERLLLLADRLAMTPDRLNDIVKRATASPRPPIRQRVLTEAKRQSCSPRCDPRDFV